MTKMIGLLIFSFALASTASATESETAPSTENVAVWWKLHSSEDLIVNERPMPVYLRSRELAYLASVSFPGRVGNAIKQVLLIRPDLKEAREAGLVVHDDCVVLDINQDGVSEVMALATSVAEGTLAGTRAIVQFDGWSAQVLHIASYSDNLGLCGKDAIAPQCFENSVEWVFSDLNHDGLDELIERLQKRRGPSEDKLTLRSNKIQVYAFNQDRFLKASKTLNKKARAFW